VDKFAIEKGETEMRRPLLHATALLLALLLSSVGAAPIAQQTDSDSVGFTVAFTDCVESIGVGLIPTEQAQALVPAEFHLVGEGQPVTPIVVRTARCGGIAVDGDRVKAGSVVQIGVVIVPPDFSGDINNYTLWYYTSDAKFANHLERLGVAAQQVPTIDYDYERGGAGSPLFVSVPLPGSPRLSLDGTVTESTTPAGSFEAIWWAKVRGNGVRMDTLVPAISIGTADLTLTTDPGGKLGQLIGGSSAGFPVLQQFNTFASANMQVSVASH
jgi:hypothetical protein